ncbi:histidine phosphatase family protein [Legionella parisiensis]|uniref:phosphoglycerate mutase (2,3-diphosphoglycerate-dependent) n=1 Tax=Legionella parisiensis TaxID=45071 RepID=A0A1E5JPY3_9GAMM|nr:histidine phosphatase family protein [Legionella parisiensis]KTD42927.1 phosphoglycerate mutase [Legionella parisiensis]OEH46592.1 2,3-bisphosphoglycerate-dependent phosphoglycerate mutase [Legionella parisiensis]STX77999.1 phosphoglycerate mutase [Legionella parisiensis]
MTTRLLVARHGNTFAPGDVVRRVGTTDLPLVDSGLHQGRMLGIYLQKNDLIPDVIFTSKLKRAIQTAEQAQSAMGINLPIEALAIFNEIDYGPDENQPEERVVARIGKEAMNAWETHAIVPAGWQVDPAALINNWMDFSTRLRKEYPGKIGLVVTSNGIARFSPYLTGDFATFSTQYGIKIATGALCVFENEEPSGLWHCRAWNVRPNLDV